MLHIVFQKEDVNTLSKSFELDKSLRGNVIQIKDDFAVGPIHYAFTEEEINLRKAWWREVLAGGDYEGLADTAEINDNRSIEDLKRELQENTEESVWLW
ncbi:MAG: DUF1835 domain-containing protein, partial [Bacteroidota bacterium]|nr:DUF1835 domain-containing protein [Bacteroidota bacterium]